MIRKKLSKNAFYLSFLLIPLFLVSSCSLTDLGEYLQNWDSSQAHGNSTVPSGDIESHFGLDLDYDTVFPQNEVNEITIQITPENWQAMLDDMTENHGELGAGDGFKPVNGAAQPPKEGKPGFPGGDAAGGPRPGSNPQMGGGGLWESDENNPIWVEAEIIFEEDSWQHVGIRFKGNSSLRNTWSSGSLKLPFKLDFDQFEDEYPKTEDQRFFGFKQLSFASNFKDDSYLREKVAADLFREAGVPSAQTAFYAVTLDYGEGPVYLGLYTAVELVDDTVIKTQFSDDSGNVYKPSGTGATFSVGSFSETDFDKETNQDRDDYSDILALFDALHSDLRLTDPAAWRIQLEAVFDVDNFLNWLAVNTVIQNWDTYGVMHHNYFLYNDPETDQLVWIPWDNNESLGEIGGVRSAISVDLGNVGENWPLISFLRDDPVYFQKYQDYLEDFLGDGFSEDDLVETFAYYHDLISPYVTAEDPETTLISSIQAFERSVDELIDHVRFQTNVTESFLKNN
jgi:spore coat protein CotH